jgi:hypothetical protein
MGSRVAATTEQKKITAAPPQIMRETLGARERNISGEGGFPILDHQEPQGGVPLVLVVALLG